jgi:3-hydroxybutyrate dehydrogenase
MSLAGRCALITGSTQGLGLAAARRLAAAGCHVVLNGFADAGVADRLVRELAAPGVRIAYDGADMADPLQIAAMMSRANDDFGGVDILVNNAVVRAAAPIETLPVEDWDAAIAVNLSAAFHTIRLALPAMKGRGWGRIINVSSIYGLTGAANRAAYVTTKTGLIGLTRAVALELSGHDITCNAVCPGTADTPVHDATVRALMASAGVARDEAERRFLATKQPTGRFVSADGVAGLILFLCGPDGGDITGAALPIDGGWSAA